MRSLSAFCAAATSPSSGTRRFVRRISIEQICSHFRLQNAPDRSYDRRAPEEVRKLLLLRVEEVGDGQARIDSLYERRTLMKAIYRRASRLLSRPSSSPPPSS